jgi:hypothetical protein
MPKKNIKFTFYLLITVCLTLGLTISGQSLLAQWTPPSGSPPGNNVSSPVYTNSAVDQTISGGGDLIVASDVAVYRLTTSNDLTVNGDLKVGTDYLYVDGTTGNVGIRTTNPTEKFHVFGDVNGNVTLLIENNGTDDASKAEILLESFNNKWSLYTRQGFGDKLFIYSEGLADDIMTFESSGNVGIGTPEPQNLLHIKTLTSDYPFKIIGQQAGAQGDDVVVMQMGHTSYDSNDNAPQIAVYRAGGDHDQLGMKFRVHQSTDYNVAPIDAMTINYNGDVGIGTTNPGAKLDISGSLEIDTSSDYKIFLKDGSGAANEFGIGTVDASIPWFFIRDNSDGEYLMVIRENGNVGIGINNTNPSHKLDVQGYIGTDTGVCIKGQCIADWTMQEIIQSCDAGTASGWKSCTTPTCPSGYVRSGCSYRSETNWADTIQRGAMPSGNACFCEEWNTSAGRQMTCYIHCIK